MLTARIGPSISPRPTAIVFPKTIEQVQAIVRWANTHKVALVPSGGRTGLSAAAVAANGEVVVSFDYMNQILDVNLTDRTAVCQPGVVTEHLQNVAEENGLYYPVDFASAGSSQIGGNIGTNAGGIKVIRYGMTRNWVAGMKVVTGKGDVLELNKDLIKNATGYDMRQLFIGAEGTLGFVVEATMRLDRAPKNLTAMVLGTADFDSIMPVLHAFQSKLDLTAFEFFSDKALAKVLARGDVPAPFEPTARSTRCWNSKPPPKKWPTRPGNLRALRRAGLGAGRRDEPERNPAAQPVEAARVHLRDHLALDAVQERHFGHRVESPGVPAGNRRDRRRTLPGLRNRLVRPHRRRQPAPEHPQAGKPEQGRVLRQVRHRQQVGVRNRREVQRLDLRRTRRGHDQA
jgi:FAD/FMN-containing dehydrogenase